MRRALALLLSVAIAAPGCATARAAQMSTTPPGAPASVDRALLVSYVRQLAIGSRVRASLADGSTVRGTLMQVTDQRIVIQGRTRIPEPPVDIAMDRLRAVELDAPNGVGRAVAVGAAAGAGGALGVLLLLFAIFADD